MSPLHHILQHQPMQARQGQAATQVVSGAEKVWLSAASAARHLDFPSIRAFYMWRRRHGIVARTDGGRRLLFAKADLDRAYRKVRG